MVYPIQKNEGFILFQLPQGKPDPSVLCTTDNIHSRPMVAQPPQKLSTCWYYALNMIRERIGKNFSQELEGKRSIEMLCSERRKLFTMRKEGQFQELSLMANLKTDPVFSPYRAQTREGARALMLKLTLIQSNAKGEAKSFVDKLITLLSGFLKDMKFDDLDSYLSHKHAVERDALNLFFLKKIGSDPEKIYQEDEQEPKTPWSLLNPQDRTAILDNMVFRVSYQKYGLTTSKFHPEEGISSLIAALTECGPMYCKGRTGQDFYTTPARQIQEVASKKIWGWNKTDPRKELGVTHSIVVVGAKEGNAESGGFVYFVDPRDGSDPANPDQQKIYVTSFNAFKSRIVDLKGRMFISEEPGAQVEYSHDIGYGLHRPLTPKE